MSSSVRSGLVVTVVLLLAAGGFYLGVRLGERASEPGTTALTLDSPSAAAPRDVALRSGAGFTGFEAGALGGVVTRSGVAETDDTEGGTFAVQTATARLEVRTSAPARLYRIVPAEDALAPGDVVVIRVAEDGTAEAVLRVPADLREGDSR